MVKPADLCPVVHVVHPFLLPSQLTGGSGRELNPVWEVLSFRPAVLSGGVDSHLTRHLGWKGLAEIGHRGQQFGDEVPRRRLRNAMLVQLLLGRRSCRTTVGRAAHPRRRQVSLEYRKWLVELTEELVPRSGPLP